MSSTTFQDQKQISVSDPQLLDFPEACIPGLLGKIVAAATEKSEATRPAVAANFIAMFCAMLGRRVFQCVGDDILHARPWFLVTGTTGRGRKGTSSKFPARLIQMTDDVLAEVHAGHQRLTFHSGGLSSGEGIGYAVRDASESNGNGDPGVKDKRLFVSEGEFVSVLVAAERFGNTLSPTLRNAWDGNPLGALTKRTPWKATAHHVVVVGHITASEFVSSLTDGKGFDAKGKSRLNPAISNGLLNRFVVLHTHREKMVPLPEPVDNCVVESLAEELAQTIIDIGASDETPLAFEMNAEAQGFWCSVYPDVSGDVPGVANNFLSRSEPYMRMLAMINAVLAGRREITQPDLEMALAWHGYWKESVQMIVDGEVRHQMLSKAALDAERIYSFVKEAGEGVARTAIFSELFQNHKKRHEIDAALALLIGGASPRLLQTECSEGRGRSLVRYFLT